MFTGDFAQRLYRVNTIASWSLLLSLGVATVAVL